MANFQKSRFWIGLVLGLLAVLLVLAIAAAVWLLPQTSRDDVTRLLQPSETAQTVTPDASLPASLSTPARAIVGSSLESAGER